MAQKKKTEGNEPARVTRIKAEDTRKTKAPVKKTGSKKVVAADKKSTATKKTETKEERTHFLAAFGGYFKGAWAELRQVRWPTRRTTWGLTLAVILFTIFFAVLIVLLDLGFQWLFDQVLG